MNRLPKKIKKCPIVESIFEIRYVSEFPNDAIFGMLYSSIKDFFNESVPQTLPILQLPQAVREQDPNFRYQAHYKLSKENLNFSIGPNVLTFSNIAPYIGWEAWSVFFNEILEAIEPTKILGTVERIGLRYINVFDIKILDKINLDIKIGKSTIIEESTNFRTEINDSNFIKVLQIANAINVFKKGERKSSSVIDIDCLYDINKLSNNFFEGYPKIIELAHKKEKALFFSLLTDSFLENLEPIYEE